jgi:hypothetical protein
MEKAQQTLLVVLVIGALVGAGGFYYYDANYIEKTATTDAYNQGYAAGQTAGAQATATAPEITWSWDHNGEFDLSTYIDADGNVATTDSAEDHLTITNTGTTDITNLVLSLKDPKTGVSGLDSDLVNKYLKINVSTLSLWGINLLDNNVYYTYSFGTVPAGATVYLYTFDINVLKNTKGLFTDASTYDCVLYAYTSGSLAEEIDFTVLT